jgi:CDP-glucose 4,6-dehydratase
MVNTLLAYQNKKVLVTGHTGFKGSWLCEILNELGARVVGASDCFPTSPSHFNLLYPEKKINFINILDFDKLNAFFDQEKPDVVFHLAAQSLVRLSYNNPLATYQTNVIGTLNILECARKHHSVKALVNVTSDKCYDNKEWIWGYRENDQMGGHDPYSSSKGCVEILHKSYQRSYFSPEKYKNTHNCLISSVRAGNVIGGGDWAQDRIIPDIIRSIESEQELVIRNPYSVRPWQHVLEPLFGYLQVGAELLAENTKISTSFNFGPNDIKYVSVHDVVEAAKKYFPELKVVYLSDEKNPHEANMLRLDCSKANRLLKWEPIYSTDKALDLTFEWYAEFLKNKKTLTKQQLNDYKTAFNSRC